MSFFFRENRWQIINEIILGQTSQDLPGGAAEQFAIVTDEGCVVIPAAAWAVVCQPTAFLI